MNSPHLVGMVLLTGAALLSAGASAGQGFAPESYSLSNHRIGAFQCLRCPKGGFLEGVRSGDQVRVRREFSAIQKLCVSKYSPVGSELYVYFSLDGAAWPERGDWGLKASSWNAECHLPSAPP